MDRQEITALERALEEQRTLNALMAGAMGDACLEEKLDGFLTTLSAMPRLRGLLGLAVTLRDGRGREVLRASWGEVPATQEDGVVESYSGGAIAIRFGRTAMGRLLIDHPDGLSDLGREFLETVAGLLSSMVIREKVYSELKDAKQRADRYAEHLAASERKFRALFDGTTLGLFISRRGKPLFANSAGLDLIGFDSLDRFLALDDITSLLTAEDREVLSALQDDRLCRARPADEFELTVVREDGTRVPVLDRSFPIEWEGETAVCSTLVDLTRRKEVEAALMAAKAEAEQANRSKSEFLSSMSHELRTPLNAILGFAQLLEMSTKEPLSERQKGHVSYIAKAGGHLLSLINDVLDLARIEIGRAAMTIEPVSLRDLSDECLALTRSMPAAAGLEVVDGTRGTPLPLVSADATRLKQVMLNLLSNAVKYNRPGGRVTLTVTAAAGAVRLAVRDTGMGIPEERRGDLFQPFSRLGREHSTIEGTGIGLTITKRLVEQMEGAIGLDSETGEGTTFWVDLRPAALVAAEDTRSQDTATTREVHAAPDDARVLLYVEDNPANLALMEEIIEDTPGFTLISAHTAELGIELARAARPAVILMDINLPGLDGFQALERLRGDRRTAAIPVIALSADAMPGTIRRGREAGFAAYLTKPVDIDALIDALEAAAITAGDDLAKAAE